MEIDGSHPTIEGWEMDPGKQKGVLVDPPLRWIDDIRQIANNRWYQLAQNRGE